MKNSTGFFFLSHSSKDIEKVRMIRNAIESEDGNPIMFYLKCLDDDDPFGDDEKLLKGLISREIMARRKFILCKSKYTEPPLSTQWIEWEKEEVRRLSRIKKNIKIYSIDIDNNTNYIQEVKEIVKKQKNILLVAPYEIREECRLIERFLMLKEMQVNSVIECGDIHDDLQRTGCYTKDIIKEQIRGLSKDAGIVVLLRSINIKQPTILQMAGTFSTQFHCFIKEYDISVFNEKLLNQIHKELLELINS